MSSDLLVDLSHRAALAVTGRDAASFLQNQLTCDVREVGPSTSTFGALCTSKGRVAAFFLLFRRGESFVFSVPADLREPLAERLRKMIFRSQVRVEDRSGDWACLGVTGPGAARVLADAAGAAPALPGDVLQQDDLTLVRAPVAPPLFQVYGKPRAIADLRGRLEQAASIAGPASWDEAEIEAGVPAVHRATVELFLPQFLNMDRRGGLSFKKGCFPGQEVVARTQHLGVVKRRMYLAHAATPTPPAPGDALRAVHDDGERDGGAVVRATVARAGGSVMLVVAPVAEREGGRPIHLGAASGPRLEFRETPAL